MNGPYRIGFSPCAPGLGFQVGIGRRAVRVVLFAAAAFAGFSSMGAHAHDSWLSPGRLAPRGEAVFELSAGNRFPVQETGLAASGLNKTACVDGQGRNLALRSEGNTDKALQLRVRGLSAVPSPLSCWLELKPFEIELQRRLVPVYLDEIRASAAVRESWAALQAQQLPWLESFRKFVRIEAQEQGPATAQQRLAVRQPSGMALEIVLLGDAAVLPGQPLEFQVLREGRPFADFPVELVTERSPLGIWRQTDAEGKLRHTLPFGGRWLLRGTELWLSATNANRWESRFVTLTIETAELPRSRP